MRILAIALFTSALLGRSLSKHTEDTTNSNTTLNDDGTVRCDGICARRLFHTTAYSSAAQAVTDTIVAYNASQWCTGPEQVWWCPEIINTTLSTIADKATTQVPVDFNDCDDTCLIGGMERVSVWAAYDAMSFASTLFNDIGVDRN